MGCILGRMCVCEYKKKNLEMRYNNVKTFLKGFVCLSYLRSNVFCVKVVLWKGSKSCLISLLIYECISVIVVLHQTWCLPLLWHLMSTFPLLHGHQVWAACLASQLLLSPTEMFHFFLSHGWLYSLHPVISAVSYIFRIDPLVLKTQPYLLSWRNMLGEHRQPLAHKLFLCFCLTPNKYCNNDHKS